MKAEQNRFDKNQNFLSGFFILTSTQIEKCKDEILM